MRNKLIKIQNNEKGLSGVDIVIAMGLIVIFIPLITTLFINIYMNWMTTKRNTMANAYATQIIEHVEAEYYDDVTQEEVENFKTSLDMPSGYNTEITIETYTKEGEQTEDLIKTITVSITYKVGKNTENVTMRSLKTKEILITPNIPKLEEDMEPIKYEQGEEEPKATSQNDSQWYSYENKRWAHAIKEEEIYVWIPRFAYKEISQNEYLVKFLYSNTNRYVDNNSPRDLEEDYIIHSAFENKTGFWAKKERNGETGETTYSSEIENSGEIMTILLKSAYGEK